MVPSIVPGGPGPTLGTTPPRHLHKHTHTQHLFCVKLERSVAVSEALVYTAWSFPCRQSHWHIGIRHLRPSGHATSATPGDLRTFPVNPGAPRTTPALSQEPHTATHTLATPGGVQARPVAVDDVGSGP